MAKLKRDFIIDKFLKGETPSEILDAGKCLGLNRMLIWRTLDRFKKTGTTEDRPGRGRKRHHRKLDAIKKIREKIRRNPKRSIRKMAREHSMSYATMWRLVRNDLKMKPFKMKANQLLSAATKTKRLKRSRLLLRQLRNGRLQNIVFSDEKLFSIEANFNHQNDRVLATNSRCVPDEHRRVFRTQKPASVMVWAAVSPAGKSPLVFVPEGAKINKETYIETILEQALKPWAEKVYGDTPWTFQQDGATSHTARVTQQWCEENCPSFITKDQWPPSSPDLNPMDYTMWSVLEKEACSKPHKNVDHLKRALMREWQKIPDTVVRAAIGDFERRLVATVSAGGGHFE